MADPLCAQPKHGVRLRGTVQDEAGNALPLATVLIIESGEAVIAGKNGAFTVDVSAVYDSVTLQASYTGKRKATLILKKPFIYGMQKIVLADESLTMNDVAVQAIRRTQNSASSIVFDEESIKQMQAFSLMDILNNLPGRKTQAPNLQSPQTLTLRTEASGSAAINNAFGIAIIIDGVPITNDANMQARGVNARGIGGAALTGYQASAFDVPYNGLDLRDLPLSNIERIEVIQGIASARYGNLSNGAILITTKAGKTPYTFTANVNGGSTSFSLSKGIQLTKTGNAINVSGGYVNSNADPRDKTKSYNTVNFGVKWTAGITKNISNIFSVSYDQNLDNIKTDPDDDAERMAFSRRKKATVSNTTRIVFDKSVLKNIDVSLAATKGWQNSYTQWLLNGPPKSIANKDTTGVYEGYFIPGAYLAVEEIAGKPFTLNGRADADFKQFNTGKFFHNISIGGSVNTSANNGLGYVTDPNKPRWVNVGGQNERPYSYKDSVKMLLTAGFYVQDNISGKLLGKTYQLGLGLRYGLENGFGSYQPRLSFSYKIAKTLTWSASYGISAKAPSLAHRYPPPVYFDVPLLNLYTGYTANSLFLVYTKKVINQNNYLKPALGNQVETGLQYNGKAGSGSVFAYYKKNKNGFGSYSTFVPFAVPVYRYTAVANQPIAYWPAGADSMVYNYAYNKILNNRPVYDYGVELMVQTRTIAAILTNINLRGAFTTSYNDTRGLVTKEYVINPDKINAKDIRYGVYELPYVKNSALTATLSTNTQIPKIGFIVTLSADFSILETSNTKYGLQRPVGYYNSQLQYTALTETEAGNAAYQFLWKKPANDTYAKLPFPYANINMRVAKEIRKRLRINFSIFNLFNTHPEFYDALADTYTRLNPPVSFTFGTTLQF